eukprot:TRINITY_DN34724_c0_g1_i1.p1 TRINITY_DN34724_c0_g1~~TRINITY_DN34724_c0_g1_i1.p1  ORF type:complete len:411 (-),score=104.54 TRINITY_DN34724_c0_g1_i1:529-1761(-)
MPPKAPAPEKRAASPQVARWKSAAEAARKARPKQDAAPFRKRAELPAKSKETKAAAAASEDVAKEAAEKAEGTPPVAGAPEDAATAEQPDVDPAVADVGARPMSAASKALHNGAWIPTAVCEGFMTKPLQLLLAVDGSAPSMMALEYLSEGIMQSDRNTSLTVYHVFDDSKTYLAPSYRRDAIEAVVEAKMTSSVSAKRWKMTTTRKIDKTAGTMVCEAINNLPADFTCLGFFGRKGCKVEARQLASNLLEVLRYGNSTNIVFKDDEAELLPLRRPTIFVVAACLDKCSTKAFLDALRLSKSGDEIHVMYVRSYMETSDRSSFCRLVFDVPFEPLVLLWSVVSTRWPCDGSTATSSRLCRRSSTRCSTGSMTVICTSRWSRRPCASPRRRLSYATRTPSRRTSFALGAWR